MSKFNILNVPIYYKGFPHQQKALIDLWTATSKVEQDRFIKTWRTPIRDPIVDKLISAVPTPNGRRENSRTAIPLLLKWCDHYNITNPAHIGYIIGTVSYESAFLPRREIRANPNTQPHLYQLQNRYWNTGYYGRGYIQITWKDNYLRLGQEIGLGNELVDNPDLALDPDISAHITVVGMYKGLFSVDTRFTSRPRAKLSLYDLPDGSFDHLNARRIVNLMDKAELIASYGKYYESIVRSAIDEINMQ